MVTSAEAPRIAAPPLVPIRAREEWLALGAVLDECGPVPCQTSDPEAWWPHGNEVTGPGARLAVKGCRACRAAAACLAYALAADERFGIWGGTLPEQRRAIRWATGR